QAGLRARPERALGQRLRAARASRALRVRAGVGRIPDLRRRLRRKPLAPPRRLVSRAARRRARARVRAADAEPDRASATQERRTFGALRLPAQQPAVLA